jgi:DNA-binding transcriptional regulator YhcF (GntR family)
MTIHVDPLGAEPPFEQVRRQVAEGAASGALPAGHKLPTVRALAATLELATNTVAKAYRALESDGVIETRGRAGTFIASRTAPDGATARAAQELVLQARRQGLSKDEAVRLLESHWG